MSWRCHVCHNTVSDTARQCPECETAILTAVKHLIDENRRLYGPEVKNLTEAGEGLDSYEAHRDMAKDEILRQNECDMRDFVDKMNERRDYEL